jgi:polyisoprenyl-phosphate glycosyltransferase
MSRPTDKVPRRVTVVIPVYQNAASLPALYERLVAVEAELTARHATRLQLVFVNDGASDESQAALMAIKSARPDATIIKLTRNFGAVHASRAGLRFVDGDAFTILAADLQDPPELLLEMIPRWLAGRKFVIAVRASRTDPLGTRLAARLYYRLIRWLVVPGFPKGGFDIALMDRAMLTPMRECSKSAFTPLLAYWLGYEPDVVPYHREKRLHGRSGWTLSKKVKAFLDVMLGFSVTPIRMISAVGAMVALASFAYGLTVAAGALLGRIEVSGFATIAILITFLLGLIILMLGIIGEYLWRIFDEVNRRPESVIDEIL